MPKSITAPLVGMHFRPPAKFVLTALPSGQELLLVAEPGNPYDSKAIKVLVDMTTLPSDLWEGLAQALDGTGHEHGDVLQEEELHLGYIADSDGKQCKGEGCPGNREVSGLAVDYGAASGVGEVCVSDLVATLGFAPDGKPQVHCRWPGEES